MLGVIFCTAGPSLVTAGLVPRAIASVSQYLGAEICFNHLCPVLNKRPKLLVLPAGAGPSSQGTDGSTDQLSQIRVNEGQLVRLD